MDQELIAELIETNSEIARLQSQISEAVSSFQSELAVMQNRDRELREAIKDGMERTGTKKYEDDFIALTYVPATTRKTIDSARLRKEQPDIAKQYEKTSPVEPSVRIKVKAPQPGALPF